MSEQQQEQQEPEPDMNQLMRAATGRGGPPTATDMNDWLREQVHSRRRRIPAWEPPPDEGA